MVEQRYVSSLIKDCFPGHALHEKGLQRQIVVGTLVSSQEERALPAPVINRLSTSCQPVVLFSQRFTWDFPCSCFRRVVQDSCLQCPGWNGGRLLLARTDLSASHPAGLAPPRRPAVRRPTQPARGVSGFWVRQIIC